MNSTKYRTLIMSGIAAIFCKSVKRFELNFSKSEKKTHNNNITVSDLRTQYEQTCWRGFTISESFIKNHTLERKVHIKKKEIVFIKRNS